MILRILDFEWDEDNSLHIELGHGVETEEVEEVFANHPIFRRTKKGHYAAFGPTSAGRYLTVIFELKPKSRARPITGCDMKKSEIQYYKKYRSES